MAKYVVIDNRMRNIEKEKLVELGYNILEIPTSTILYPEISSHPDIFCCKIKDRLVVEKSVYDEILKKENAEKINNLDNIIIGDKLVKDKYPNDILYNICIIGNYAIHNFKYTDKKILELIEKYKLNKINIKQGYSKCSIAVIDESSVIVTDKTIAKTLNGNGIKTLVICDLKEIKLLNKNNTYSKMNGFIGGLISKLGDTIFVSGDLRKIDKENKIREFIEKRNLKIIDFPNLDLIDYGGIIEIDI